MKVYIVLEYSKTVSKLQDLSEVIVTKVPLVETCRVDRVYRTRSRAEKRAKLLDRHNTKFTNITHHVIEKTLKGRPRWLI